MRIAFIAPFGMEPKGTVSARMVPLAQALARRGHMVRVVIPPWDDPSARPGSSATITSVEGEKVAGVHTVTLAMSRRVPKSVVLTYGLLRWALRPPPHLHTPFERKEHRRALRALTTFRPEVVHVFKPVGYSGLAGFMLSGLRVPWVLDTDDWEGPGGWADANPYSRAEKAAVAVMDTMLPRTAGAVTAASRALEARAWSFGLPRRKVLYMPNGVWREKYGEWVEPPLTTVINLEEEAPMLRARYGLEEGAPVVLLYTRFAEFPWWWALDMLRHVREEHTAAKLLVVGSGFFGEEEKLRAEAERMGLEGYVAIAGRVGEKELPKYLGLGDVVVYPMADNLINRAKSPVKVLEPMVMGLPIVAHALGEAAEFVGDAGVLVEPGDVRGMGEAVSALLKDPERRRTLGDRAKARVWSRFNWEGLCEVAERGYGVAMGR